MSSHQAGSVLITGGAGFIGANLAHRLLRHGNHVRILDNLSRAGVRANLEWLQSEHKDGLEVQLADVRDEAAVRRAVEQVDCIYHLAAQVAVTSSLENPVADFEVNVRGTLNVLEAMRRLARAPALVLTSTNKVYGALDDVALDIEGERYLPADRGLRKRGIDERRQLDFHSPYGCSKGAADQYVLDYARSYHLPTVVFRMSCIYGPHQFGNEDQGWLAHFMLRALQGESITIYGDGRQVRDVLFVEDLLDALLLASQQATQLAGHAFNMGGGTTRTLSLLELVELIQQRCARRVELKFESWRRGDQRYYVSDTRRFSAASGWRARTGIQQGLEQLWSWLSENYAGTSARYETTADTAAIAASAAAAANAAARRSSADGVVPS